jgi:hypothetical protein
MSARGKKRCLIALSVLLVLILCRATIPISVDGDWMGSLSKCACGMYSFLRFQNGHIVWYGHGGEPARNPRERGTYAKTGWNTYSWVRSDGHGTITVRPGWLLGSFDGVEGSGRLYCWRYPLFWKADRIVRESQRMTADERKKEGDARPQ